MRPWERFTNQRQWKEYLQNLLRTNDVALYRALVLIARHQTPEEVATGATLDHNGVGFGSVDAEFLTAMAFKVESGRSLSEKELAICRNKMPKYWKQLYKISRRKMENEEKTNNERPVERSEEADSISHTPPDSDFSYRPEHYDGEQD